MAKDFKLKSGKKIEGEIVYQSGEHYRIKKPDGNFEILFKKDILNVTGEENVLEDEPKTGNAPVVLTKGEIANQDQTQPEQSFFENVISAIHSARKEFMVIKGKFYPTSVEVLSSKPGKPVAGGPEIKEEKKYYDIQGMSWQELSTQMNRIGCENDKYSNCEKDKNYVGGLMYQLGWSYQQGEFNHVCYMTEVKSILKLKFLMPRWVNFAEAPSDFKAEWNKFYNDLTRHEDGHKDIAMKAAKELQEKLAGLGPEESCKELAEAANQTGTEIVDYYERKQANYDIISGHGVNQGQYKWR